MLTRPEDLPGFREKFNPEVADLAFAIATAISQSGAFEVDYSALAEAIKMALATPGVTISNTSSNAIVAAIKTALDTSGVKLAPDSITALKQKEEQETTISLKTVGDSDVVPSGAYYVAIANTGKTNGLVLGNILPPKAVIDFTAPPGKKLAEIEFDAVDTELQIQEIR